MPRYPRIQRVTTVRSPQSKKEGASAVQPAQTELRSQTYLHFLLLTSSISQSLHSSTPPQWLHYRLDLSRALSVLSSPRLTLPELPSSAPADTPPPSTPRTSHHPRNLTSTSYARASESLHDVRYLKMLLRKQTRTMSSPTTCGGNSAKQGF